MSGRDFVVLEPTWRQVIAGRAVYWAPMIPEELPLMIGRAIVITKKKHKP